MTDPDPSGSKGRLGQDGGRLFAPHRMLAFSDGVFAIAITLLILPLADLDLDADELGRQILGHVGQILVFLLGFGVIGLYWMSHHAWLSRVVAVDNGLLKINLAVLACIGFLPFPTSVLGTHGGTAGVVFYAVAVGATGAAFELMWAHLVRHPELLGTEDPAPLRRHAAIGVVTPAVFVASIPLAFVTPRWAPLFWILVWPVSALVGRRLDRRSGRGVRRSAGSGSP